MLDLRRLHIPNLRRAIPRATDQLSSHALRQTVHSTFVARVLERWIPLDVNHDDSLIFATREEAGAGRVWDDIHDEAFMVDHFLDVIVFAGLSVQGVHFVREVDGARHYHVRALLEGKTADCTLVHSKCLSERVLVIDDFLREWIVEDDTTCSSLRGNWFTDLTWRFNLFKCASFLCHFCRLFVVSVLLIFG